MKWDGDADQQLLLAILATHPITINHDAVAARIGPDCTPRAVIERLKKLKKMAKDRGFEDDVGTPRVPKTPTKATAAKGGAASPVKKKATGLKKVKATVKQEPADADSQEPEGSPEDEAHDTAQNGDLSNGHSANGHLSSPPLPNGNSLKRSRDDYEHDAENPLIPFDSKRLKEELGPVLDEPSHFSNGTYGLDGINGADLNVPIDSFVTEEQTYFYDAVEDSTLEPTEWAHPI